MERRDYQLGDTVYSLLLPPPTVAMPLCNRSAVLIGTFANLLGDLKGIGSESIPRGERIALVLEKLGKAFSQVDPLAAHQLLMDAVLAAHLSVNGKEAISTEIDFNKHFEGRRGEIYPVLFWCLWECVSDFFPQSTTFIQEAVKVVKEGMEMESQSPEGGK